MAVRGTNMLLKCMRIGRNPTTVINAIAPWEKVCDLLIKELLPSVCWKEAALLYFLHQNCFSAALTFSPDSFAGVHIGLQQRKI